MCTTSDKFNNMSNENKFKKYQNTIITNTTYIGTNKNTTNTTQVLIRIMIMLIYDLTTIIAINVLFIILILLCL